MAALWQYSAISEWIYRRQADTQALAAGEILGANYSIRYTPDIDFPIDLKVRAT